MKPTDFLNIPETAFTCPNCQKQYDDSEDKYLDRCNRNKSGYTVVKCECGVPFGMTYNIEGDAQSFFLQPQHFPCTHGG
jgi:hypothetical protein